METDHERNGQITMKTEIRINASHYLMGFMLAIAASLNLPSSMAQDGQGVSVPEPAKPQPTETSDKLAKTFDEAAGKALVAMKARAEELNIKGVAVAGTGGRSGICPWDAD